MKGQANKVAIIIPSGDMVHAEFVNSLTNMLLVSAPNVEIGVFNIRCSHIDKARNEGVRQVVEINKDLDIGKFTHVLFIDSDQTFPPNALLQLLARGRTLVAAGSVTRQEPVEFTCRDFDGQRMDLRDRTGLVKVASCGFSFMLIHMSVFSNVGFPWFRSTYRYGGEGEQLSFQSEDECFCEDIRGRGISVMVDADLSKKIGHLGTRQFTVSDID